MAADNPSTDDLLRSELLRLDVLLRKKQTFWETPRAILLIVATTAAIAGVLGWRLGNGPQTVNVRFGAEPLHVQLEHGG